MEDKAIQRQIDALSLRIDRLAESHEDMRTQFQRSLESMRSDLIRVALAVEVPPRAESA
jgi:hypothetical protein